MLGTVQVARLTQILVEDGWSLNDQGYNTIQSATHEGTGEEVLFTNDKEFTNWLTEKAKEHGIL